MTEHWNEEWRDQNSQIKYPFADTATLTNGTDIIDVSLFVDARLYPIGGGPIQYISNIDVNGSEITFYISTSGVNSPIAKAVYNTDVPTDVINVTDLNNHMAGVLVGNTEKLVAMKSWADGEHIFTSSQTQFAASVVVPIPINVVNGIIVDGEIFVGDVWLVGENGCVLNYEDGKIRVDFVGDAYYATRYCWNEEDGEVVERIPIESINGITPDEFGNISITVGNNFVDKPVLRIRNVADQIVIETVGTIGTTEECD